MGEACCHVNLEESVCGMCGTKGKSVPEETLRSLVKEEFLKGLDLSKSYFFCPNPECDVVYHSTLEGVYLKKEAVKVRVGLKEKEPPITLCYCFNITKEMIEEEIVSRGETEYPDYIKEKVKRKECECELKNPSGRCCLGEVSGAVKEIKRRCLQ